MIRLLRMGLGALLLAAAAAACDRVTTPEMATLLVRNRLAETITDAHIGRCADAELTQDSLQAREVILPQGERGFTLAAGCYDAQFHGHNGSIIASRTQLRVNRGDTLIVVLTAPAAAR